MAFTIVATVGLGLGLVAVAFTVLNALLFRVDAVPDVHEMFAVHVTGGEREPFTVPAARAARLDPAGTLRQE